MLRLGIGVILIFPAPAAGGHLLFSIGKKVGKNPTAAPDAMKVSALALSVIAAPANAEKEVNEDSLLGLK